MTRLFAFLAPLFLMGCSSVGRMFSPPTSVGDTVTGLAGEVPGTHGLALLSWVGGISTLAGIAALVFTRGSMGMRAVIGGVCLIVLNIVIANYLSWILIPVLIGTGGVSLCWAYVTISNLIDKDA